MANVAFKKGLLANLPSAKAAGTFYVTTDERAIYLDVDDSTRIRLGDFIEVANTAALPASANVNALYYVTDINCLAKWNGTEWIQINRDTGATSIEVVGEGNAVTAASYDAVSRKLTLTMGETFATKAELDALDDYVGEIPADKGATIVEYINKKAEETLSAAQGGSSETAASVAQALQNYKDLTDPRLAALEAVDHEHANKAELDKIVEGDKAKWDAAEQNAKDYADSLAGNYDAAGAAAAVDSKLTAEVERAQGAEQANAEAAAAALAEAQKKVASVGAGDASVTVAGTDTAPTVAVKLDPAADNALKLNENGLKVEIGAAPEYSIVKAAESGEYAAIYNLTKDGVVVGASINIPKDMVVKSGSVDADGNIVLVLNDEANTEIVIDAGSLIEYVTSGSVAGDMIVVNVSDDHKVTATITDGTITAAKLTVELQTAIGQAHSHENAAVLAGITEQKIVDGDKAKWDAVAADHLTAADKTELEGDIAAAQAAAEKVANDNNTAMDTRVKALEEIDHEAYKAYADQAETDAVATANAYADGLADNYDAAGSAAAAQAAAEKTASDALNAALAWGEF